MRSNTSDYFLNAIRSDITQTTINYCEPIIAEEWLGFLTYIFLLLKT